jgi:hypothetical protein
MHFVRAGQRWLRDVHWEECASIEEALEQLRSQARVAPSDWLVVLGGWHPLQFAERRAPTKDELDRASPRQPVFVQHLYAYGLLNQAALDAIAPALRQAAPVVVNGVEVGPDGRLTGVVRGMPTLQWVAAQLPQPDADERLRSVEAFSSHLARFGITGVIDGGGFGMNVPSYSAVHEAWRRDLLSTRVRLMRHPWQSGNEGPELENLRRHAAPRFGDSMLQLLGAGEILLYRSHDRVGGIADVSQSAFVEFEHLFRGLAEDRWTVHVHAHNAELIQGLIRVWSVLAETTPVRELRWSLVHAEMLEPSDVAALAELGAGVLTQALFRFEGDKAVATWGADRTADAPPLRDLLAAGVAVGLGTDATTVASYNPFATLEWFVTGRTLAGDQVVSDRNLLTRAEALHGYTSGSAWFSFEEASRGSLRRGQLADLAVLDDDYFAVSTERLGALESALTMVGGKVVWSNGRLYPRSAYR